MPDLSRQVDDIVFPLDEELEGPASSIASSLRKKGRSVHLVEDKRLKWYTYHIFPSLFIAVSEISILILPGYLSTQRGSMLAGWYWLEIRSGIEAWFK